MTVTGIIHKFDAARGFGFILGSSNGISVFFHVSDWVNADEDIAVGRVVEYEIVSDPKSKKPNKKKAVNVRLNPKADSFASGMIALIDEVRS